MKRKVLALILTGAMAFSMAACGEKEEPASTTTDKTENTDSTDASNEADDAETDNAETDNAGGSGDYSNLKIQVVAKGFQHDFWKAVKLGAQQAGEDFGLKENPADNFVGPKSETDVAEQVEQIKNAINKKPDAICLAALDTTASLDPINQAMAAGIPIVGFDSGVPDAPEGAVVANAATDNYAAGSMAADEMYELIKDKITDPADTVRIGVISQEANSQSIVDRTQGFLDRMVELVGEGKIAIEGHDKFNLKADGAKVIMEVGVPANVQDAECVTVAQKILGKKDLVAVYGSNEFANKNIITANQNLNVLGKDKVIAVGFDSGKLQLDAVRSGVYAGAITQNPVQIGYKAVELAVKAAAGEPVEDVDTGCLYYTAENMDSEEIAPCLYE